MVLASFTNQDRQPLETFGRKGVFTTLLYPSPVSLKEHLNRLVIQAALLGLDTDLGKLEDFAQNALLSFPGPIRVRIMVSDLGWDLFVFKHLPRTREIQGYLVQHERRNPQIKSLDYLDVLAEIRHAGSEREPIFQDRQKLLEGATTNLILIRNQKPVLPKGPKLHGLGIRFFQEKLAGTFWSEEEIRPENLGDFEEILLTNAVQGVMRLRGIENTAFSCRSTHWFERLNAIWNEPVYHSRHE